jgi:hypothetical protein
MEMVQQTKKQMLLEQARVENLNALKSTLESGPKLRPSLKWTSPQAEVPHFMYRSGADDPAPQVRSGRSKRESAFDNINSAIKAGVPLRKNVPPEVTPPPQSALLTNLRRARSSLRRTSAVVEAAASAPSLAEEAEDGVSEARPDEDQAADNEETNGRLRSYSEVGLPLAPMEWDSSYASDRIMLTNDGLLATAVLGAADEGGQPIRSKLPLPRQGVHCFEYVYTRSNAKHCVSLGGYYMAGLVSTTVPHDAFVAQQDHSYNIVYHSSAWWGLEDDGTIFAGDTTHNPIPTHAKNRYGRAYGEGDVVGLEVDMNEGTMRFYRNGQLVEGGDISGLPTGGSERLHLVACPFHHGSTVKATKKEGIEQVPVIASGAISSSSGGDRPSQTSGTMSASASSRQQKGGSSRTQSFWAKKRAARGSNGTQGATGGALGV